MSVKIVFAIQSAVHDIGTLAQLVDALGNHRVVIHHDFSQQPEFKLDRPNVHFVPDPLSTGWGSWSQMQGALRSIAFARDQFDFDYLQVLTPVDLPIRPIQEFEAMVRDDSHDAAVDYIDLSRDNLAFMSFAYRGYAPINSLPYRVMWALHKQYFGPGYQTEPRAGLALPVDCARAASGRPTWRARAALTATRFTAGALDRLSQPRGMPLFVGSAWFGVNRRAAQHLLDVAGQPGVQKRFSHLWGANEMLPASILAVSGLRLANANHAVSEYEGAHPVWIDDDQLAGLRPSGRYFARKFPDDSNSPVRLALLQSLATPDENQRDN